MQHIPENHLNQTYADHASLFIVDDQIIVNSDTQTPLMPFLKTVNLLNISIKEAYLDEQTLLINCHSIDELDKPLADGFYTENIKNHLFLADSNIHPLILRAAHIITWDNNLQFCSKCQGTLYLVKNEIPGDTEKKCKSCESSYYPNLSPAVMVLIRKEDKLLLARSPHFKPGVYSAIAGFVDIGETAEDAAHREVKEEVGLNVSKLKYFGSQSWPFPNSFMIAFTAECSDEEINIDPVEIEDAQWFDINSLPKLPSYPSIARELIESAIKQIQ